jgi:drug/metabolite transporter (DMT)-like permease
VGAVVIWGSTYVVTKDLLEQVGPFSIAVARFLIALAVLIPFARPLGYRASLCLQRQFLLFGLTGVTLYHGLQNLGLLLTTAGSAALIAAAAPAATAVLSFVLLGEGLTASRVVGIALSVLGVTLVVETRAELGDPARLAGNLLVLGSAISWAAYTVQGRKLVVAYPPLVATTASFGAGTLILLPIGAAEFWLRGTPHITVAGLLAVLYLGLGASALAFYLWNRGLRFLPASVAAPFVNLIPVVGLLLAILVGETVTTHQIAGGALVVLGVLIAQTR